MLYRVLLTQRDSDGFVGIQLERDSGDGPLVEQQHAFGFFSRPLDPDDDGSCTAFGFDDGDDTHAILGYDARIVPKIPELPKGSSMQYGATGSYHQIAGDTGTHTLYLPYEDNTKCQTVQISPDGISIIQGDGTAILATPDGVTITAPDGATWYSVKNGEHAFSGSVNFAGAISQAQGVPDAVAKMTPLVTLLGAMATIIDAKLPAGALTAPLVTAYAAAGGTLNAKLS
jgi:hypothetical protein